MNEVKINKSSEIFQIITDFGDPLEIFREAFQNAIDEDATKVFCRVYHTKKLSGDELIIDIWNNGHGLQKTNISNFFDLAYSTKVDENGIPIKGKLGYKGHGAKIYFNSKQVIITSKTKAEYWSAKLDNPIEQLEQKSTLEYSDFIEPSLTNVLLPEDWSEGFWVRITGHLHFKTEHTKFKLNHKNLRDYSKWFTVFGSIATYYNSELRDKNIKLYLQGIDFETFKREADVCLINPKTTFETVYGIEYEIINLGHYFPPERFEDKIMKKHIKEIGSNKPFWEYYSRMAHNDWVSCDNNTSFYLMINVEGYETKREYDILLTQRGKARTAISHTDVQRYGIWACKGGIPVEKIDNWIEGGKGQYSYLQAFVDCDDFKLTANRGSIHNTEIEKLDIVKKKLNEIFSSKKISDLLNERKDIEEFENILISIEEDGNKLEKRFKESKRRKSIILPNGTRLKEPSKLKTGYSESETMVLLIQLTTLYPQLFTFKLEDYDTTKGIDFVIEENKNPKYIELKGTLDKRINHPFRYISKFITYDLSINENDIIEDNETFKAVLKVNKTDIFQSFDENLRGKKYTSYKLDPDAASIPSMEIIQLKSILTEILEAKFE
ncbi:histidine kinase/DNA gyrase B/HSP90-like ATPase [Breznakibacter xylanolyticus]|uniref:Histidine kinase/DNA gyrase B/HSP90-like ATPase n=1 Tax=Breznakibacter xylanolyticus TaxID=990 RepID=A0A2W7MQJ3_9BACT|nr:ATP-binding protein [Breznakibacter xylanolyticus]PZX10128.1 histidine kinase/DNA gyrase B/HSP90-like ATPase [Breznakibacter xylanolyticus]